MLSSNIPSKIPLPFAYAAGSGFVNPIPTPAQSGGKASLHDGFPPVNFTPIGSGGIPPWGSDMNGILNEITAIQQWQEAGGFFPYDPTFSAIISGYPKGAILQSSTQAGLWVSTAENNSTDPDSGSSANWLSLAFEGMQAIPLSGSSVSLTYLQSAYPIINLTGALTQNCNVLIPAQIGEWIIVNNTTGAFTVQVKTPSGTGINVAQNASTYSYGDGTNIYFADSAKVASFNGRTGAITLNATDVTSALGFTPYNSTNPAGYLTIANFPTSLIQNGYEISASGLITQWGNAGLIGAGSSITINYPIVFPNNIFITVATNVYGGDNSSVVASVGIQLVSKSQFIIRNNGSQPQNGVPWVALGF